MNLVALLIGLGPLLGWGFFPTVASKIGGKPANQLLGTTIGTLLFATVFFVTNVHIFPTGSSLILSVLSGLGWDFGQIMAFKSYQLIGSSRVMPITTAFQLIATSLWGVFALGNWHQGNEMTIGFIALIAIIIGAIMTSWNEDKELANKTALKKSVLLLLIGTIGYWAYSAAPQAAHVSGTVAFLPQAIGMVLGAIIYGLMIAKKENVFKNPVSYKQIWAGFFFAFAALTYLISAQPDMNGLATGFLLSQTSVVLATLSGVFMLHENKTTKELWITIIGLILIIASAAVTILI